MAVLPIGALAHASSHGELHRGWSKAMSPDTATDVDPWGTLRADALTATLQKFEDRLFPSD